MWDEITYPMDKLVHPTIDDGCYYLSMQVEGATGNILRALSSCLKGVIDHKYIWDVIICWKVKYYVEIIFMCPFEITASDWKQMTIKLCMESWWFCGYIPALKIKVCDDTFLSHTDKARMSRNIQSVVFRSLHYALYITIK